MAQFTSTIRTRLVYHYASAYTLLFFIYFYFLRKDCSQLKKAISSFHTHTGTIWQRLKWQKLD